MNARASISLAAGALLAGLFLAPLAVSRSQPAPQTAANPDESHYTGAASMYTGTGGSWVEQEQIIPDDEAGPASRTIGGVEC